VHVRGVAEVTKTNARPATTPAPAPITPRQVLHRYGGATTVKLAAPGRASATPSAAYVPGHCVRRRHEARGHRARAGQEQAPAPEEERRPGPTPAGAYHGSTGAFSRAVVHRRDAHLSPRQRLRRPALRSSGAMSIRLFEHKVGLTLAVGMALALAI
jgi:hypothetical protein